MKNIRIPTVFGLGLIVVGVIGGVFLVQNTSPLNSRASVEIKPTNVQTSNITDKSFTVSWSTSIPTTGLVKWGTQKDKIENIALVDNETNYTHYIKIDGLSESTQYFYEIYANSRKHTTDQGPYIVSTGKGISPKPVIEIASGKIITSSGLEVKNAIVYINIAGGNTLSDVTTDKGVWIIPVSNIRSKDLSNYLKIDDNDYLDIFVDAGTLGTAQANVNAKGANPVPPITLGGYSDFTNETINFDDEIPSSSLESEVTEVESSYDFIFD